MIFNFNYLTKKKLARELNKLEKNPNYRIDTADNMFHDLGEISNPDCEKSFRKIRSNITDIQNNYDIKGVFDINQESFLIVALSIVNKENSFTNAIRILYFKVVLFAKESKVKVHTYHYDDIKEMNMQNGFYKKKKKILIPSKEQDKNVQVSQKEKNINEKTTILSFKLGCYTHSSDFGFGSTFGPGFHWDKNYSCYNYSIEQPSHGTSKVNVTCPNCKKNIILKVPSYKRGEQKQTYFFIIAVAIILLIIFILTFNFDDKETSAIIKTFGTVTGSLLAYFYLQRALSNWFYFMPKLKKDFKFRFMKHKLFY
jgi:hypothetical protein